MHYTIARLGGLSTPATGFTSQPEPRSIGSPARGRQLVAGNILFAGHLVEAKDTVLWDIAAPSLGFSDEAHGFAWLDDLAAIGDGPARKTASLWCHEWTKRYGKGKGAGWVPDLTGRRVIRMVHHALFLLRGASAEESERFFHVMGRQTVFLSKRWSRTSTGLPRFEALTGLIYAGLALEGMGEFVAPATTALARECRQHIDETGGIPTRNPEELLEVFTLLTWAAAALRAAGWTPAKTHLDAISRIAPTLRALRHVDGELARFHGGGRGIEGRLDHALVQSGNREVQTEGLAMGFARLSAGRSDVIIDALAPPAGRASHNAHASTLAFELTSGRRAVIVNCGSGVTFGDDWRRAGRATPSHSTLCLEGQSSARLGPLVNIGGVTRALLVDAPTDTPVELSHIADGYRFEGAHDGYVTSYGLTHSRQIDLSLDGRSVLGGDSLFALDDAQQKTFDKAFEASKLKGLHFDIRFHLHPDVDAEIDLGGTAVSLALKSGEIWVLRPLDSCQMRLEPSVYLERNRLRPRATKQVVLSSNAMEYASRIRWSLAKAHETDIAVRDMAWSDKEL